MACFPLRFNNAFILYRHCHNKVFNNINEIKSMKKIKLHNDLIHTTSEMNGCVNPQILRMYQTSSMLGKKQPTKKGNKKKQFATADELSEVINLQRYTKLLDETLLKLKDSFTQNLTIRTDAGALDKLEVEFEGDNFPLNELAEIAHKSSQLVVINMSSFPQAIPSVLKSIDSSGMNINPQQDGTSIFVKIPKVTKEHREALAKNAKTLCNNVKVDLRNLQNSFLKEAKKKNESVSGDLLYNVEQEIMSMADSVKNDLEALTKEKQNELLQSKSK